MSSQSSRSKSRTRSSIRAPSMEVTMLISGMSGNEIYCLAQKGFEPGEIVVGNSVCSMGLGGAIGSFGQSLAGGEISAVTELISGGRHAAIQRMQEEARRHGAVGVTSVVSELRSLAGYTEFLAQGTSVHAQGAGRTSSRAPPRVWSFTVTSTSATTPCDS